MSDLHARRLLVFLLLAAVALTAVLVRPFWAGVLPRRRARRGAAPRMEWLAPQAARAPRARGGARHRRRCSLVGRSCRSPRSARSLVRQVVDGVEWLRDAVQSEGVGGLVERLPGPVQRRRAGARRAVPQPQQQLQKPRRRSRAAGRGGGRRRPRRDRDRRSSRR